MAITQENRELVIATPLGKDVLLLTNMSGTEQLGRPFRFDLELASEDDQIEAKDIVGQNVTIRLDVLAGEARYFNGYISRFTQLITSGGLARYRATMVPWLWFLTRTADCRIFQNMTVPDIIEQVFGDRGFSDFERSLSGEYRTWEYCVQYRETDFNFVSRLMEQEGIYYFFRHKNGEHSLVLADSAGAHQPYLGYDKIKYHPADAGVSDEEYVSDWTVETCVQPGSYALNDFDFKNPDTPLQARTIVERDHANAKFEIYDYPGEYVEFEQGEGYTKKRIQELHAQYEVITAGSDARGICTGCKFTLTDHPREDQNREYLITSANYNIDAGEFYSGGEGSGGCVYSCSFTAIAIKTAADSTQPFRSPRITPKPSIPGPQTAMVVGPSGEEIWTDEYGRVKVQFHWDRYNEADENSSCWIRVAQVWAGKNWGAMYIPRIGQEVIIEFLEGDPDQPIITGRVYNAQAMPPYDPKSNKTMSTIKSNSSDGGGGFNEIRFEDKKGEEQIFIHAEKDEDVRIKNDSRELIGKERHLIVKSDQLELVECDKHLTVKGNQNEKIDGTISIEAGSDIQEKAGSNYGFEAGSDIHIKAGMNVVIEAGVQLSIKAGSSFVDLGPAGVSISGTLVNINSGGSAGSGAGCKPDAPKEPKEAATADPGQTSEPPRPPEPPTPVQFSPQATVLKEAAKDGTPFCEECEKAKQQAG
ncbi:MAG TPA: type VI secretion system tip protein VgrG [Sedimentisphaerales bacterium]|nr:type VI secretion system tip protein VgrG [Sedimentisphaerales bacterium]